MKNPNFMIEKRPRHIDLTEVSLPMKLTNWKLRADGFYRASEVLFITINRDNQIIYKNAELSRATKTFINRGYVPMVESVYFLTLGLALENMMKGVICYNNPALIAGKKISDEIKIHNLTLLSKKTGIEFSENELNLLEFLTMHVEWFGKYPLPADAKNSVGTAAYSVVHVRKTFADIYRLIEKKMVETGELKDYLHHFQFSAIR